MRSLRNSADGCGPPRSRWALLALVSAVAVAVACGCGGPGAVAGAQATQAAAGRSTTRSAARHGGRGRITGSVVDDGCARTPCPLARPPLPVTARVVLELTGPGVRTRTVARTISDGQGRFTVRVEAGSYRLAATPVARGPTCPARRVHVSAGADLHVVVSCG